MRTKRTRITGSAVELVQGRPRHATFYGTYKDDVPDPRFRFRVGIIDETGEFEPHTHEYSEILIVLEGRATHLAPVETHPLEAGDVVVINRHTRHGLKNPKGLKLCIILYDPSQFLKGLPDLGCMAGYHALFDPGPRARRTKRFRERLHLSPPEMVYVTSLISAMKSEFDARAAGRETVLKGLFSLLVAHLSRLYGARKRDRGEPLTRMAQVIAHIQTHYREPLEVGALARLAHWSVSQFRRNFKRAYHATPIQFISRLRLQEACDLLRDPNRDITGIALDLGFSSSAFFSAQFKRHLGETPSQYRRRAFVETTPSRPAELSRTPRPGRPTVPPTFPGRQFPARPRSRC
jgi:AraC family L-rhamnose operon transcriptional activator RhaR/AraC family L-rhamnose operon regulatory protein RhaS